MSATHPSEEMTPLMRDAYVGRRTAFGAAFAFVAIMAAPLAQEVIVRPHPSLLSRSVADWHKYGLELALPEVEKHLVYESQFAAWVRQPYQRFLSSQFHQGSRLTLLGGDSMLFHRNDIVEVAGHGALSSLPPTRSARVVDPVETLIRRMVGAKPGTPAPASDARQQTLNTTAILSNLSGQLAQRGVHLVVMVVPGKGTIYPELLWPRYPGRVGPAWNADYARWREAVVGKGVDVLDLSEAFWAAKSDGQGVLFLMQDTHWAPRGVAIAAEMMAEHIRPLLADVRPIVFDQENVTAEAPHDLLDILGLEPDDDVFPSQTVQTTRIEPRGRSRESLDLEAPVLLFGDSLSGYFESVGSSRHAGLRSQLMRQLGFGVQEFVGFGDTEPGVIQRALDSGDVLRGKKVAILEFHMGALSTRRFTTPFSVGAVR